MLCHPGSGSSNNFSLQLDRLPNDNNLLHHPATRASFTAPAPWPSLPPIIAVLYKSGLRPFILNQPRVATCYRVHCWLVSASAEKGTTVLAFPIMGFVVKRQGNNKQIYVWGEKLFVFDGKLTPEMVGGVRVDRQQCRSFHTLWHLMGPIFSLYISPWWPWFAHYIDGEEQREGASEGKTENRETQTVWNLAP